MSWFKAYALFKSTSGPTLFLTAIRGTVKDMGENQQGFVSLYEFKMYFFICLPMEAPFEKCILWSIYFGVKKML